MHSRAFNPSPLPLRSLLKTLSLLTIVVLIMSYTYWTHLAGIGTGFRPWGREKGEGIGVEKGKGKGTSGYIDEPTGKGWGMGRGQHFGTGVETEDEEGKDEGEVVSHNGLLGVGGPGNENEEELQEADLSPGWQTAQAASLPTWTPKLFKPGFQGHELNDEEGEGGDAAFLDTGGSGGGYPGLLTDEKVAKEMGLVVATPEEVEAWEGLWRGREEEGEGEEENGGAAEGEGKGSGLGEGDVELGNEKEEHKVSEEGSTDDGDADNSDAAKGIGAEKEAGVVDGMKAKSDADADAYAEEDRKVAEAADVKKEGEKEGKDDQGEGVEDGATEEAVAVAVAVAEEESNGGQQGEEEPKWTPLKAAGERKVSTDLMDYDFLPD